MSSSAAAEVAGPTIRSVFRGTNWVRIHHDPLPTRVYPSDAIARIIPHKAPSWSVSSLLPTEDDIKSASSEITREKLHHLLKLSALPLPKTKAEEQKLLHTLRSQVHFVKQVQSINTDGVKPLVCIRDETTEAKEEDTITLDKMKPWLEREDVDRNGTVRLRRPRNTGSTGFDAFNLGVGSEEGSGRRQGRYFVVKKNSQTTRVHQVSNPISKDTTATTKQRQVDQAAKEAR